MTVARGDGDERKSIAEIELRSYPYETLCRFWNVVVSGGKNKLIRQKTPGALKQELRKMAEIKIFKAKLNIPKRSREKSIIKALLSEIGRAHV